MKRSVSRSARRSASDKREGREEGGGGRIKVK